MRTITINGHDWMRKLRFPRCTVATLRDMRVGDELVMLDVFGPASVNSPAEPTSLSIAFERERGYWNYQALWMLHIGHVHTRGHLFAIGQFRLLRGSILEFFSNSESPDVYKSKMLFERICRLSARLARMAAAVGDTRSSFLLTRQPRRQYHESVSVRVPFLDTISRKSDDIWSAERSDLRQSASECPRVP